MKQHNILNQPQNFTLVERIYRCPALTCKRTVVTYTDGLADSRHTNGLPNTILSTILLEELVPIRLSACDHHGGIPFRPDSDYANPELSAGMNHVISRVLLGDPDITPRLVDEIRQELESYDVNPRVLDGVIL